MNIISRQLLKIADLIDTNNEQYQKAMYDFYPQNKRFVDFTLQQDRQAQGMFKRMYPNSKVKLLYNGNTFLKYIDTEDVIIILALLSRNGKLNRDDIKDALKQLHFLLQQMQNGKKIETSCNNNSLPLLKRLQKMDPRVKIEAVSPQFNVQNQGTWRNYIAYI